MPVTLQKKQRHTSTGKAAAEEDPCPIDRNERGDENKGRDACPFSGALKHDLKTESSAQRGASCARCALRREAIRGDREAKAWR
jgi:hypothetical protein